MFAVTALAALRVNVQLLVFAPPLLQAPDQMALRVAVSLIEVPMLKLALLVNPVFTLRPAGVEVTVSPVLPDTFRVNAALAGAATQVLVASQLKPAWQEPQLKVPPQPS